MKKNDQRFYITVYISNTSVRTVLRSEAMVGRAQTFYHSCDKNAKVSEFMCQKSDSDILKMTLMTLVTFQFFP